ncbi:MAG TPA: ABC transporter substrate-binding protein [Leptospiraceae bacterium]|nr:ABC transporter substrate-binding protein [Leptospiraceae bacterium]HNL02026.1 ABC transporter substrate-binding protein [Leptospiraceae bacterium]
MKQLSIAVTIFLFAFSIHAEEESEARVIAPIKKLIGSVRYSEKASTPAEKKTLEDRALEYIGSAQMADFLLGDFSAKATPEQKEKFASQIREYTRYKAFPLVNKYFKDIDLTYEPPVINGDKARVQSSVVYAGSERLTFSWVLTRVGDNYVITDFLDEKGTSTMQTNKDRQVQPTLKAKGIPGLLATMEGAVNQVKKAAGR